MGTKGGRQRLRRSAHVPPKPAHGAALPRLTRIHHSAGPHPTLIRRHPDDPRAGVRRPHPPRGHPRDAVGSGCLDPSQATRRFRPDRRAGCRGMTQTQANGPGLASLDAFVEARSAEEQPVAKSRARLEMAPCSRGWRPTGDLGSTGRTGLASPSRSWPSPASGPTTGTSTPRDAVGPQRMGATSQRWCTTASRPGPGRGRHRAQTGGERRVRVTSAALAFDRRGGGAGDAGTTICPVASRLRLHAVSWPPVGGR